MLGLLHARQRIFADRPQPGFGHAGSIKFSIAVNRATYTELCDMSSTRSQCRPITTISGLQHTQRRSQSMVS